VRAARAAGVRTLAVGAAAHVAVEAHAAVDGLRDVTLDEMADWLGIASAARRA
jgi:hypothetical protein